MPVSPFFDLLADSTRRLLAAVDKPSLTFIRLWGNTGDELIYAGARRLLAGLDYREIGHKEIARHSGPLAAVAGSGGWSAGYDAAARLLPEIEARFERVVILPSSYEIAHEPVRRALGRSKALFFARERTSHEQIRDLCRADLALDTAFCFGFDAYRNEGKSVLNAFRTDRDSLASNLPDDNLDVSLTCRSVDAWLRKIGEYALVRTDRAHIMIAAAMLGKTVEYRPARYHKVEAIAEYALSGFSVSRIP